jgi:hypothetical protein
MERWQSPAECTALEMQRTLGYRGFESLPLRISFLKYYIAMSYTFLNFN